MHDGLQPLLEAATPSELRELARLLKASPPTEPGDLISALQAEYLRRAWSKTYRDALVATVPRVASRAGWATPRIPAAVKSSSIEEYLEQAISFATERAKRRLDSAQSANAQRLAEARFGSPVGHGPGVWLRTIGAVAQAALSGVFLAPAAGPYGLSSAIRMPASDRVVDATIVLIKIRARLEGRAATEAETARSEP